MDTPSSGHWPPSSAFVPVIVLVVGEAAAAFESLGLAWVAVWVMFLSAFGNRTLARYISYSLTHGRTRMDTDTNRLKAALEEFVSRAELRDRYHEPYKNELRFTYKGRVYSLQQALYIDGGEYRYQHFLQRDGRLLNIGALRKTLADMSWDMRYEKAQTATG
jgi:hypothetical protein